MYVTIGLRPEHIVLISIMLIAFLIHPKTRTLAIAFFPYAVFGIIYDSLRLIPLSWRGHIHVRLPYLMESSLLHWFGLPANFMLGNFFQQHHLFWLDLVTATTYSLHVLAPIAFAFWLWRKKSDYFSSFTWAFFAMNMAAFATYVIFPTAPPWYVSLYGFKAASWNMIGNPAGLSHFDAWIGTPYFADTYARAAWNFGAVPSMHAAYPLLLSLFARHTLKGMRWFFYGLTFLVGFSAVYLNHHYLIDLFIGWSFALTSYLVFVTVPQLLRSQKPFTAPETLEGAPD